jgi:hypothetical protein
VWPVFAGADDGDMMDIDGVLAFMAALGLDETDNAIVRPFACLPVCWNAN